MIVDLHCHIDLFKDAAGVAAKVQKDQVVTLSVTTTPSAFPGTQKLGDGNPWIRTALGIHPELAKARASEMPQFDRLLQATPFVGEVGLDGSARFADTWATQREIFEHVLRRCSEAGGRILSVHSRSAAAETLRSLKRFPEAGMAVLHWFTGGLRDLDEAIEVGCWFSVGPAMLGSSKGRRLVARMPTDRVITESDGPCAKAHGEALFPWDVSMAFEDLATIWGVTASDVSQRVFDNFECLLETGRTQGVQV